MRTSAGYTAVELVLTLATTAIVGALFVSAVRTYSIRNQVANGTELARRWSEVVETRFRADGRVPANWNDIGADPGAHPSSHVGEILLVNGRVDVLFGQDAAADIAGRRVSLTPFETADRQIVWLCGDDVPGVGLQPLGFVDGGTQSEQVPPTIAARYLPLYCR